VRKLYEADFMPLYEQKLSDGQIAERLGVARITVKVFRRKLGLPAVATGGRAHYRPSAAAQAQPRQRQHKQEGIALENSGLGDWPNARRVDSGAASLRKYRIGLIQDAWRRVVARMMEVGNG